MSYYLNFSNAFLFNLGLDFAWLRNGYVYHTKFDNVKQIPMGTLQRTGDNILALAVSLVNNDKMANTEKYASGNLVFFDFLGAFMFRWSEGTGMLINTAAAAASIYCLYRNMKASVARGEIFCFTVSHETGTGVDECNTYNPEHFSSSRICSRILVNALCYELEGRWFKT